MGTFEDIQQLYKQGKVAPLDRRLKLKNLESKVLEKITIEPVPSSLAEIVEPPHYSHSALLNATQKKTLNYLKKRLLQELVKYSGILESNKARLIRDNYLVNAHLTFNNETKDVIVEYFTLDPEAFPYKFPPERIEEEHLYLGKDKFNICNSERIHEGIRTQVDILLLGLQYFNERIISSRQRLRSSLRNKVRMILNQGVSNVKEATIEYFNKYDEYLSGKKVLRKKHVHEIEDYRALIWEELNQFDIAINNLSQDMHISRERALSRELNRFGRDVRNFMAYLNNKVMGSLEEKITIID